MTGIFDHLLTDWHDVTHRLHHHHGQPAYHRTNDNQGDHMNLTEIHQAITNFTDGIEGWTADMRGKLPEVAAKAQQFASSPIFAALDEIGAVILPPGTEQAIAALIRAAAKDVGVLPATSEQPLPAEPEQPAA